MRVKAVLGCVASFSSFVLAAALLLPGSTYALWTDRVEVPDRVVIQPAYVTWETNSSNTSLLVPVGDDSHFAWNAQASAKQIVRQITDDTSAAWYGVAASATIDVTAYGALSWQYLFDWDAQQSPSRGTMWDKSQLYIFRVDSPADCTASNAKDTMDPGEDSSLSPTSNGARFYDGMAQNQAGTSGTLTVCVAQIYTPIHHTDTAKATAQTGEQATSSWSAIFYHPQTQLPESPRLGLSVTPIDPLNGPATQTSGP